MRASARVVVERRVRHGRPTDVLVDVRSEPPLALRATPGRVLVAASAAGPVGGDHLTLEVDVGQDARLVLGTVAATVVWPGRDGAVSTSSTSARVARGGRLELRPEPTIVVRGARHRVTSDVELDDTAELVMVDDVVLGRTGEPPGHVEFALRVNRGGLPLVHHEEHLGPGAPGWGTTTALGSARHLLTAVVVGVEVSAPSTIVVEGPCSTAAAWLPVASDAALLLSVGADALAARAVAERVVPCGLGTMLLSSSAV